MQHKLLLQQMVDRLKLVHGLRAIVLGGSYASGSERPDSDIDIGLYYDENQLLDTDQIRSIASLLNDAPNPIMTDLGGWGTWVNGGAWLTIGGQRVDFLYRNLDFVSSTIDDCNAGYVRSDSWQQPAYGFHSFMYCAETAICRPLYDPDQADRASQGKGCSVLPSAQASHPQNLPLERQIHARQYLQACLAGRSVPGDRVSGTNDSLPCPSPLCSQRNLLA
jgi:hypothetical protein